VDFASVPRFSDEAIKEIPKYVFENCNQVTCNEYTPSYLNTLKEKARIINLKEWRLWWKDHADVSEAAWIARGEEYDWIYGLDVLERELLPAGHMMLKGLTIDSVIRYNGIFSRLGNSNPGEFRIHSIRWAKYDMEDLNEIIVMYALEQLLADQYGEEKLASLLRNISAPGTCKTKLLVKRSHIEDLIKRFMDPRHPTRYESPEAEAKFKENWHLINPNVVQKWIEKQGRTDDKLDISVWLREVCHYFPVPSMIKPELAACLKDMIEPGMHPIEKASRIWFDIVRIHISHEANKRTGKAIGSAILLAFGYLPPKIGKEDEKEYVDTLKYGFEDEQGLHKFTKFVAKMITKTHHEMSANLNKDELILKDL
jgi:hypothetical protein